MVDSILRMRNRNFITSPKSKGVKKDNDTFISVVILGENHGYRMKSYGPISLIKVGSIPLIERQISSIKAIFKNFEIVLCSGFETSRVFNFIKTRFSDVNIRIVENQVHYNSNDCESARLCINNIKGDRLFICGGGSLFTPDSLGAMTFEQNEVLLQTEADGSNFEIGAIENAGRLENFSVGIKNKFWTEIAYLNGQKVINAFYSIVSNPEYKNKFIFEAINDLSKNHKFSAIMNNYKPIIKLNNIKTLKEISRG